jgi:hypothetical protein
MLLRFVVTRFRERVRSKGSEKIKESNEAKKSKVGAGSQRRGPTTSPKAEGCLVQSPAAHHGASFLWSMANSPPPTITCRLCFPVSWCRVNTLRWGVSQAMHEFLPAFDSEA